MNDDTISDNEFRSVKIGDMGEVITGTTPPTERDELFGKKYPFITPGDINNGERYASLDRFLSEAGKESQSNKLLPKDSVCFTCIGATIGKICMTDEPSFTNQQINSVVVYEDEHDPFYIFYLLKNNAEKIKKRASGAATPIVNKTSFSSIKLKVPPLPKQNKIGSILSAFDDLIENNKHRIEILEEMAEIIYREWFVNFNFPGSEDIGREDSELGEKPKTWNLKKLDDVFKINYGDTLPQKEMYDDGLYPAYAANGVVGYYDDFVRENRVVLVSCRGAKSGKVLRTRGPSFITNNSLIIEPHEEFRWIDLPFIHQLLKNRNLQPVISGSAQRQITISSLSPLKFLLPDRNIVENYGEYVLPIYDLVDHYVKRNQKISEIRDLLLPRLISGEIEV